MLTVFAGFLIITHIVRDPIKCWAPVHFADSHRSYMDSYCWVKNTYYLPWHDRIPHQYEDRKYIIYYQWLPFILLGQAMMFYAPTILWHGLNSKAGIDADSILETANKMDKIDSRMTKDGEDGEEDLNEKTKRYVVNQFSRFLGSFPLKKEKSVIRRIINTLVCLR